MSKPKDLPPGAPTPVRVRKWWKQIVSVFSTPAAIFTFLHQLSWWPFNQAKESPNQSVVETNNGAIGQVNGPVQQIFYNGYIASPSPQSSPTTPSATPFAMPAPTALRPESQSSVSSTPAPIDLDESLSEGLKKVLRAASVNFSNFRGDLIGGQETFGKVYTYKGTLIFDHASFAQCTQSASDDWVKLWYSYTIFYEHTSNEDSDRKMSDLRERLGYILTT